MVKGPTTSKNNLTGIDQVGVTLANSTAKTWTHTFGATPVAILVFLNAATDGGRGTALEAAGNSGGGANTGVAITSTINTITLTPGSAAAGAYNVLIVWAVPTQFINGDPITDFV